MSESKKTVSRRQFLKIVVPATGLAATGLVAYFTPRETVRDLYRIIEPDLAPRATGRLAPGETESMVAFSEALCRVPIDSDRYGQFYQWRSENIPGHYALYQRFSSALDERALSLGVDAFSDLPVEKRIVFSDELRDTELEEVEKLWATVGNRDWILFNKIIVEDTLRLFANTDLWFHVGYENYIGMPRGLEAYTKPVHQQSPPDSA